ncbi:amino acid adenylation domain-containing protein [Erwinia amylovora Ea644]|nr:amino acid adenylation domain-containing protein [Erwinia amylovora Ea644]
MNRSIINRVLDYARRQPDAPAIYWQHNVLSYQQLQQRVMTLAERFRQIRRPGPIAVHLSRTPDLIATLLAVWCSGRTFVALDAKHPVERRRLIIAESAPAAMVYDSPPPQTEECQLWHISELLEKSPPDDEIYPACTADDTAYLLYTSGSTGKPKGIAIGHHSVEALVDWAMAFYTPAQLNCVLASTTITFDLAIFEIFVPLATGKSLYLVDSALDLLNGQEDDSALTLINTVPSVARELVRARAIPAGVTTVNLAGEALHWKLVNDIYQSSQVACVCNLWGPSEDTTYSTAYRSLRDDERPESGPVPIGWSITGSAAFIMNDALQPVSCGELGEICLTGTGLAQCYHGNPELTAERFPLINGPDGHTLRMYRTGDWGRQDRDGMLHFHGRIDFQVKIRGYRIELEELEQALLTLDEVREAAVIVHMQQEQHKLVAVLVKTDEEYPDSVLIQRCQCRLQAILPPYMMPHAWNIYLSALPRTTSGKICRRTLNVEYSQNLQGQREPSLSPVMQIIAEALGGTPEKSATFLAQGGDSLSAVRLQTMLRTRLGKSPSLEVILSSALTIEALEQQITALPEIGPTLIHQQLEAQRLSAIEYRMFKVYKTHREPACYNIGLILRFDTDVDVPRLRQALLTALPQSRALSCYIEPDEQGACYRPASADAIWNQETGVDLADRQRRFFARPFRLESEPPVQALWLDGERQDGVLLLSVAHTAVDGLGLRALLRNISSLYRDRQYSIPTSPCLYQPAETHRQAALAYWQHQLAGFQAVPPWPQGLDNLSDGAVSWTLSRDEHRQLASYCRENGVTLPVLLMATLCITLQRLSGCPDLVIATPVANRQQPGVQDYVANMTNSLPLRCRLHEDGATREAIAQIQQQLNCGLAWQDVSIDWVVENLLDVADKEAIFNTIFSYMDFLRDVGSPFGLPAHCDFYQPEKAKAPLVVSAIVTGDSALRMVFEYQGDKLHPAWVNTLSQLFMQLLNQRSAMGNTLLHQLSSIPLQQQPLLQRIREAKPVATAASLVAWLAASAEKFADRTAIQDCASAVTYAQLWRESEKLAAGLQVYGVKPGEAVGVKMEKSWRLIAVLCAILRTGAFYVPLDPRNPAERNQYISQHSGVFLVVVDDDITAKGALSVGYASLLCSDHDLTPVQVSADELAYIIFTSGTTGQPKGVTITHHNVCRLFSACHQWGAFSEQDSWTLFHSYAFDFSVWEIFGALLYGGRLVIVPPALTTDMLGFASLLDQQRISVLSLTPTAFRNFIGTVDALNHRPRMIIFGGEAIRSADVQPWWQIYGLEETRLINMYGITEITVHATVHTMSPDDSMSCIGKPLADTGIVLRDERGLPCPVGVPGELCIRGGGVSHGYFAAPELNRQRFGALAELGPRYYFSGDLAVIDGAGRLNYLGRQDKQVKINGHRIELDEISGALRQMPCIKACLVKVVTIDCGTRMLVAWYVAEQDIEPQALVRHLMQKLPVWAIPEKLLRIPALPLTINGKIDESQLTEPSDPLNTAETYCQQPVKHIWQQILGHEMLHDDLPFFEAGGTSIKAALLVQYLNRLLEQPAVSLLDIFRHPCIRDQQRLVDQLLARETI